MSSFLFDQSSRGKILVKGHDRIAFLHNMLSNDIKTLRAGEGCYAALLTPTAKVLADMYVYVFPDHILLDTETGLENKIVALLDRYIIQEDVQLTVVTPNFSTLILKGSKIPALIEKYYPSISSLKPNQHVQIQIAGIHVILICRDSLLENGYVLITDNPQRENIIRHLLDDGKKFDLTLGDEKTYNILCVEEGILRYGIDMDENLSLPETGLDDIAVSETKGCYPGQEVVARTKAYKGLQRKITGITFQGEIMPQRGDKIYAGDKEIGFITSSCFSSRFKKGVALGVVSKGFFDTASEVVIRSKNIEITGVTTPLPFIQQVL